MLQLVRTLLSCVSSVHIYAVLLLLLYYYNTSTKHMHACVCDAVIFGSILILYMYIEDNMI